MPCDFGELERGEASLCIGGTQGGVGECGEGGEIGDEVGRT